MIKQKNISQFIKFSFVGVSSAIVSLAVYSVFIFLGAHYLVANIFAFVLSVLNSFILNNFFVFRKKENEMRNPIFALMKTYISYMLTGVVLQSGLLFLFVEKCYLNKIFSQLLCIIINLPINFILNKFWAFKIKRENNV